ncbi:MAG TPA: YkvA family protein [Archangium sp.]|uniref:YkvA family protein n=1 Tax=Archangium sp. TaxID=1872627 RepID=UPI002E342ED2|nr:YkvA family protein [Archangium sp.]HEX5747193.1 YkvA family protein [Archangium sp.]
MNVAGLRAMGTRFFRYVRDPRVPLWRRLAGLFAVIYFVSPVDALPDFLPILGWLDDVGVLSAVAFFMVREVQNYQPEREQSGWPQPVDGGQTVTPPLRER